ncbi:hypothetical protein TKK_0015418 [Trichogramma kaykai]
MQPRPKSYPVMQSSDKLVCNGNIDCANGEDERTCSHVTVDCSSLNKFKCSEGSCVHWNHTCDKYPHCIGWEDEDERLCKINECLENNGNCMQECIDLPIGYKCLCRKGFEMIQKTRCIGLTEVVDGMRNVTTGGSPFELCHPLELLLMQLYMH